METNTPMQLYEALEHYRWEKAAKGRIFSLIKNHADWTKDRPTHFCLSTSGGHFNVSWQDLADEITWLENEIARLRGESLDVREDTRPSYRGVYYDVKQDLFFLSRDPTLTYTYAWDVCRVLPDGTDEDHEKLLEMKKQTLERAGFDV